MNVQRIWMVGSARTRYLGGPAWTQASPSRAGCFGLKASSVQSDCPANTPSLNAVPWGRCARANTAAGLLPAASGTAWVALVPVSLHS